MRMKAFPALVVCFFRISIQIVYNNHIIFIKNWNIEFYSHLPSHFLTLDCFGSYLTPHSLHVSLNNSLNISSPQTYITHSFFSHPSWQIWLQERWTIFLSSEMVYIPARILTTIKLTLIAQFHPLSHSHTETTRVQCPSRYVFNTIQCTQTTVLKCI